MLRRSLAALVVALLTAVSISLAVAQTGTPVGSLRATGAVKSEGQALPGASVKATDSAGRILTTLSDANGNFTLSDLTPGNWTLDITMFGFENGHREIQVNGNAAKIDFNLQLAAFPAGFGRGGIGGGGFGAGGFGGGGFGRGGLRPDGARPGGPGQGGFGPGRLGPVGAPGSQTRGNPASADSTDASLPNTVADAGPSDAAAQSGDAGALAQTNASGANESFLVNGSLSTGVQAQLGEFGPNFGPGGFGGPGAAFGTQINGQPGQADGPPAQGVVQGPAGGFGGGGFGGGPGGFGGGGGRGGGGGFGGPGGRGGRGGFGGPNGGFIGNRRNAQRNQIRGSVFYTARNSALDAAPFSINGQTGTKAAYAQNRYGFNLGGPLEIPKLFRAQNTFFTINYNGNLSRNGNSIVSTVPTLAERGGDFAGFASIIDPTSKLPFVSNRIAQINPIAQGLLAFIPTPNQPGVINNYRLVTSVPNNNQNMNIRVNQTLSRRDQLSFGVGWQTRDAQNIQNFGFIDPSSGKGINATVNYRHTYGAGKFQSLTGSFNRNSNLTTPFFANGANVAAQLGIQGASSNPSNFGPPNLSFTNFAGLSDGSPSQSAVYSFGFNEIFSIRHAKHNWSMGGGYTRNFNNTVTDSNGRGTFTFTGAASGVDFADFLLGLPQSNSIRFGSSNTYFRSNSFNLFMQDDYRMTNNLTLNLGLRYEYFAPWHEKYGRIANLVIAPNFTGASVVTPAQNILPGGLIQPDRNNLGPRLALAWKPRAKKSQVVRVGYGIYYNPGVYNQFASRLSAQPPFAQSTSIITSIANPLTLASGLTVTPAGKTILNTFAVNPNYRSMYAQSWNINLQSNLPGTLVAELSYLGTKGTRLDIQEAPNQAAPGDSATAQLRQPIGNATNFTYETPDGNSIYHAAQARLTRRFRKGLSGNLLYIFAKSIDNSSTLGGAGNSVAQNFLNLAAERGLSSFDRRHSFTSNFVVTSPIGGTSSLLAKNKTLSAALKDWTLSPAITLQSGTPLTARVLGTRSDVAGTGVIGSGRADATGLPIDSGSGFFNTAAFTATLAGPYGSAGRNTITGPGTFTTNLSLQRTLTLRERLRLNIRMDANNATNHVNITGLGTVVNSLNYGVASSAGGMRNLSVTLRFNF